MYRRHRDRSLFMCTSDGSLILFCFHSLFLLFIEAIVCWPKPSCCFWLICYSSHWQRLHRTLDNYFQFMLLTACQAIFFSLEHFVFIHTFITLFWVCRPFYAVKKTCEKHESKWWWNIEHSWSAWINRWKLLSNQFTPIK